MQEKLSIKWNIIKYDENTLFQDIEDILLCRLGQCYIKNPTLDNLHDPYLLEWMDIAVGRIIKAKENWEKVMIFWDYDVDWVTATSILMHFFKKVWITASYRLPHRINDWYGFKKHFVDELKSIWVDLIITVDCGTKDIEAIDYAKQNWIDVIVTDHHAVPEIIPENAITVINPKRNDCSYPYSELSGAWVSFKLMSALAIRLLPKKEVSKYIESTIDIAAIWTVADCMSLTWENRVIVELWLKQLKKSRSSWIRKLIESKINEDLDSDIFSFLIWPKLNAAGRMDTPYKAINLILNNWHSLDQTIAEIEELNDKRRKLTFKYYDLALENINEQDNIIFYESKDIPHWIIWIVAWKLTEKYYKPSIVLIEEDENYIASCRSPNYFSIIDYLEKYNIFFVRFWWHKQAAWFTISKDKFYEFKQTILSDINKQDFSIFNKSIQIDKLISINEIGYNYISKINRYKPFWIWNPKPVFMIKDFKFITVDYLWKWYDHLKFSTDYWFKVVAFGLWEYLSIIKKAKNISIIFELNIDNYNWNKNIQLNIIDLII